MTQAVMIASLTGALVPLFWGVMSFLLFNLKEGIFSKMFWGAVQITCPSWVIEGPQAILLMPSLNALLYGSSTALFLFARKRLSS